MADQLPPSSPASLQLRGAPATSARLSKKAAFVAVTFLAVVLAVVMVNVSKPAKGVGSGADTRAKNLQPALNAANSLTSNVPDVVALPTALPAKEALPALPDRSLPVMEEKRAPVHDTEAEARLADSAVPKYVEIQSAGMKAAVAGYSATAPDETTTPNTNTGANVGLDPNGVRAAELAAGGAQAAGLRPVGSEDLNQQSQKVAFLKSSQHSAYLYARPVAPLSPFELKTGTVIPGLLVGAANSDLPGELIAQVSQNVYDSATGSHVLIPQGSKLFGHYDSAITYGQSRLLVRWQRLIYPNGYTLELEGMQGHDQAGDAGFSDQVNNHLLRLFGYALLSSVMSAGIQLSQPQSANALTTPSSGQIASAAVGQQVGQLGVQIAQRNLQVQPTITIRKGYRLNVMVNKDVVFPGDYGSLAQ